MKLTHYSWQGINNAGVRVQGTFCALNQAAVLEYLHQQTITPLKIRKQWLVWQREIISKPQIQDFIQQLATLLQAGIALVPALTMLAKEQSQALQQLIMQCKQRIEAGDALSEALQAYPQYFDSLCCNLVAIGEQSGSLVQMLKEVANYQQKLTQLTQKIRKALWYPALIIGVATLVTIILVAFVVPQFQKMFAEFGATLPLFTQIVLVLANQTQTIGSFIIIATIITVSVWRWCQNRPRYALKIDQNLLRLPWLGKTLQLQILARLARTLAITFSAGVPLAEALQLISHSVSNRTYQKALQTVHEKVLQGEEMHQAMAKTQLFPSRFLQLLAVAAETGTLHLILLNIADYYEQQFDQYIEQTTKLFEPVTVLILGVVIGALIIALYLPIFQLGNVV